MKTIAFILTLAISTFVVQAEELRMAVCSIDYAVRNHPEFQALKKLAAESPSKENDLSLQQKERSLRTQTRVIAKQLATERKYEWVFEVERTRKETQKLLRLEGMLLSYSGDDISEEVADLLRTRVP